MTNMVFNIFDRAVPFQLLRPSNPKLKTLLCYNPDHNKYTALQNIPGRNPNETDRGGWRGYDRVYSKYFEELKDKPINFMEIGVLTGYGLLTWKRFFSKAKIYGIEILMSDEYLNEMKNIAKDFPEYKKVKVEWMDSTDKDQWLVFLNKQFDVIIDDGGHHPDTQIKTFEAAWPYLKPGGLYFIEDISHRYSDVKLKELDDFLSAIEAEGHFVEVVSHENTGMKYVLEDPSRRKNRRDIHPDATTNATEYIVAIRKSL